MQRAENQMAGAGGSDSQLDCFQVAHFAHQNHIGVFAQCASQGRRERFGVDAYLTMVHQAILALVHEFDRVLNRNDVIAPILVHIVNDRRQRGGFSRTGGPGHYHQPFLQHGKFFQHTRQRRLDFFKILK